MERFSPFEYNWSLYEELFKLISNSGLKLHVALCFHSNMHSSSRKEGVTLPLWILEVSISLRGEVSVYGANWVKWGTQFVALFAYLTRR